MIKEALQYLLALGESKQHVVGEQIFSDKVINQVWAATPKTLVVRNLSGLVEYVINNYDKQPPMMIHVAGPTEVNVYSTFNRDMVRNELVLAKALLPEIPFKRFLEVEEFNILLQSCFVDNDHRSSMLAIIGNIQEENVATFGDDGVSQQVTAKTGIATVGTIKVPNPVRLKPFRTFVEIIQPESNFVFRMQKGPVAALFEADGGAWKIDAIRSIREYLDEQLSELIVGKVVSIIS